jgi:hypothetical protein
MRLLRSEFASQDPSRSPSLACLTSVVTALLAVVVAIAGGAAAVGALAGPARAAAPAHPAAPSPGAALNPPPPGLLDENDVASDLEARLAKWQQVEMPWDDSALTAREKQLVNKLVDACRLIESIFWRQVDPQGLALYKGLSDGSVTLGTPPRAAQVRRLLWINGGRWDLLDENRPFVGHQAMPPGRSLYPPGLTRQQIESYVAAHPETRRGIYDEHTVVESQGGRLVAVPYHIAYRRFLEPAARALREAAALSDDPAFAHFLRLRADALLSDDYYASDLAWLDLANPKLDLVLAPYEVYYDELLGVKTSFGAAVMIRNDAESAKLAVFQKYVPEIQDALPLPAADRPSKKGHSAPMEVVDSPFRAGDLRHGYQVVADNLPNDPRVHERKGSKHLFFKNFLDLRVSRVILPVARLVMREDQAARVTGDGYLAAVMMHEVAHGLGPAFSRRGGKQMDIREALGPVFSGLEEAKADVAGMVGLHWLVAHQALPASRLAEYDCSYVAGIFRSVRFGVGEPHARAEMMEFNYLAEKRAIVRAAGGRRYEIDLAKIPGALTALATELLQMEATGDRARAEGWFARYGVMPRELQTVLAAAHDVPVDIDPRGSIAGGHDVE